MLISQTAPCQLVLIMPSGDSILFRRLPDLMFASAIIDWHIQLAIYSVGDRKIQSGIILFRTSSHSAVMELVLVLLFFLCHATPLASTACEVSTESDNGSGRGRDLNVVLMTSSSLRFNSSGAETAVRLALDRVNAGASILPRHKLQLAGIRDTKVYSLNAIANVVYFTLTI